MVNSILVPIDGSDHAWEALDFAISEFPEANLTCLHVIDVNMFTGDTTWFSDPERVREQREKKANALFAETRERVANSEIKVDTAIEYGDIPREIVKYIEAGDFDLTVISSQGRTGLSRALLGSVAESVVRHSPTPVLVVR